MSILLRCIQILNAILSSTFPIVLDIGVNDNSTYIAYLNIYDKIVIRG